MLTFLHGWAARWRWMLALVWVLCGGAPLVALAQPVVDVSRVADEPVSLTPYLSLLEDPDHALTLAQLQQPDVAGRFQSAPPAATAFNLGFTRSAYWLRVVLRNPGETPREQLLEVENPRISGVDFFQPDGHGVYQTVHTGGDLPFATRVYPNRNFVFPIALPAHSEQQVYLRVQSTIAIIVPVRLWSVPAFHAHERNDYLVQAWYFGMALAMALFNLMLFVGLKDRIYLQYVLFVIFVVLTIASKGGMASEFLWPGTLVWTNVSYYVCAALALVAFLLFMRGMLETAQRVPRMDRLLRWCVGVYLVIPLVFLLAFSSSAKTAVYLFMAAAFLILFTGVLCAFKRQRSAYFFVGAFGMLTLGGAMTTLRSVGVLPTNALTVDGLQLGSALEMLLLAFALADRFNVMRREKDKSQRALVLAQQQLVDTLKTSERVLEQRVAERTHELQVLNTKLETLSLRDGLTGIANRRHFDAVLAQEWRRSMRLHQPLALLLLDVDWFKRYNDHYGHQAGDQCLQAIAGVLASAACRAGDVVARYGGEEFVFIAPATDGAEAMHLAQKICEAVRALALPHQEAPLGQVTISCGVAVRVPVEEASPAQLIGLADAALYRAKAEGRNQACAAAP